MPNIIGGKYKKTKLDVPSKLVRPTSAFKREAIFSILESYSIKHSIEIYKNKSIIDIFAGSGLVGLEAISRGMEKAYFIENSENVIKILDEFSNNINDFKKAISEKNGDKLLKIFASTKNVRKEIIKAGQDVESPDFGRKKN